MDFNEIRQQANTEWDAFVNNKKPRIIVGAATCGQAAGANAVIIAIKVTPNRW
jgi:NADH-quinone oxidoreductase subunit F/NADP-reducing hydrogenase subunit HndC